MIRPKETVSFVCAFEEEQKVREESGEVRAAHADIQKLMIPYETRLEDLIYKMLL